ncbi:Aste57867_2978 [Aphanomyces stellatus]|uniref:Aste57867_2978 protein n=1 Tax=Aphanomyces stellatus TaxID=120398 RepID=A0A485KD14_9STRA|nr:hypothetical protein As57867_002969 [Aphanomyces stellatus]VFT80160.1 Aste57867_2978 [Aphanomyces stellatus]
MWTRPQQSAEHSLLRSRHPCSFPHLRPIEQIKMILHEFRIPLHMTTDEFQIAELYMTLADTVQVLKNEPYDNRGGQLGELSSISQQPIPRTHGQYTVKLYSLGNVPAILRAFLPQGSLTLVEETWSAFPHSTSYLTSTFFAKSKFVVTCDSVHLPGYCAHENALSLTKDELKQRTVDVIHVHRPHPRPHRRLDPLQDPATYVCTKTGRGPLQEGWETTQTPAMTVYKVMRIRFDSALLRHKMEDTIRDELHTELYVAMRKLQCMSHRWHGLSMADIRILEAVFEYKRGRASSAASR